MNEFLYEFCMNVVNVFYRLLTFTFYFIRGKEIRFYHIKGLDSYTTVYKYKPLI